MKEKIVIGFVLILGISLFAVSLAQSRSSRSVSSTVPQDFLIIGHRGASGYAPEHTIEAYRLAEEMGADYVEIDLQQTKDGELVAMHDETVDRTTNSQGLVNSYTLAELKLLDAGSWFNEKFPEKAAGSYEGLTVPTLREVFEEFGASVNYYIETKSPDNYDNMEQKLMDLLNEFHLLENPSSGKVILQSFSQESLAIFHQKEPDIPLIQLLQFDGTAKITNEKIEHIKEYAVGIGTNYKKITDSFAQQVRQSGLELHPYTVNDEKVILDLFDMGATGVFTDYIEMVHKK
ncbi:glycerophosphodiester phosphodiesterase [Desemzia sp. RIT804]|uniref:glycerophosphodiester phosphodiesterase n=1 Tax=Desemzia sp. RIT 804 TaxID=2810209 RepID=UPI0019529E02|nr:glycerophosphodiester phosphodiesterase [Desemzia sp. RIT 804]MBM6615929.1 glycerophosphodiester phosphodiesterase [Desemzia sp. RIT 804]